MSEEVRQEPNGTWMVDVNMPEGARIVRGIPTRELAEEICAAMWEMYQCGLADGGDVVK